MPSLVTSAPPTKVEIVTELLHGTMISDPYRWLEDQGSEETRRWLIEQGQYTASYLAGIADKERILCQLREFLAVDSIDSPLSAGDLYVFRKRVAEQEQASIYLRSGISGRDELLLDPLDIEHDPFTAIRPVRLSSDGKLLLVEIKKGGERKARFALIDLKTKQRLPDELPHGYLRGFAFAPDSSGFYYVHEPDGGLTDDRKTIKFHLLGSDSAEDPEIFSIDRGGNSRLHIIPGDKALGFIVYRIGEPTLTDFYLWQFAGAIVPWLVGVPYKFGPMIHSSGRLFAVTDLDAPNLRIVELRRDTDSETKLVEVVPEADARVEDWRLTEDWMCVSYARSRHTSLNVFNLDGKKLRELVVDAGETVRMTTVSTERNEFFLQRESFSRPIEIYHYSIQKGRPWLWSRQQKSMAGQRYRHKQLRYKSKDGTEIPIYLVGRGEILSGISRPTIMTSYGGFGISASPQFSVLATYLMDRGCLFALPKIRGGSDFGERWHNAAKRRHRQVAIDDFLCGAEWLVNSGHADRSHLAIFGGSHSGLLVLAAMTQRPDLFRAVLAIAPLADMIRYHLFDRASQWREEYGIADNPEDFTALSAYSPYHGVGLSTAYPATMIISGDRDQNCNALHARKMIARLQAANISSHPILLDYHPLRGHSPTLPLTERINALTNRVAFLVDQLDLQV